MIASSCCICICSTLVIANCQEHLIPKLAEALCAKCSTHKFFATSFSCEGHILLRTEPMTDWQARWRKSRKQESVCYTAPRVHQAALQKGEITKSEWWEVVLSARKICPALYSKKQVAVKQPHYLKLQGKQEEANQTQALRTSHKGWARLQARRACWQFPGAAVKWEHLDGERKRKGTRQFPFNKLFRGSVSN